MYRVSILTTYSSSKPCSSSGSPVTGSQSFTRNLSVHRKVPDTGRREGGKRMEGDGEGMGSREGEARD